MEFNKKNTFSKTVFPMLLAIMLLAGPLVSMHNISYAKDEGNEGTQARIIWRYYDPNENKNVSGFEDWKHKESYIFYTEQKETNDGVQIKANNYPNSLIPSLEEPNFLVYEDYAKQGTPGKDDPINITKDAKYKEGVVKLPSKYKGKDLTVLFYNPQKDISKIPVKINISHTAEGTKYQSDLTGEFNTTDSLVDIKALIPNFKGTVTVKQGGSKLGIREYEYNREAGIVSVMTSVLAGNINIDVSDGSSIKSTRENPISPSIVRADSKKSAKGGISIMSVSDPQVGETFSINDCTIRLLDRSDKRKATGLTASKGYPTNFGFAVRIFDCELDSLNNTKTNTGAGELGRDMFVGSDYSSSKYWWATGSDASEGDTSNDSRYKRWIRGECDGGHEGAISGTPEFKKGKSSGKITITSVNASTGRVKFTYNLKNIVNEKGDFFQNIEGVSTFEFAQGDIELTKTSEKANLTNGNPNYSLAGAVYRIYDDSACGSDDRVASLTTDTNGKAKSKELDVGPYWVKEYKASPGYKLDTTKYKVTVESGETVEVGDTGKVTESPQLGQIKLIKRSGNTSISDENKCYSLAGAIYQVKGSDTFNTTITRTLTTDENGLAQTPVDLPFGKYTVKESKPSKGYAIDPIAHSISISKSDVINDTVVKTVTSLEMPKNDPVEIILKKIDNELQTNKAQGSAGLEGAEYTVKYYDEYFSTPQEAEKLIPKRTWIFKTDETGYVNMQLPRYFVSGDPLYYGSLNDVTFPQGSVTLQETKTPPGYLIDDTVHVRQITGGDHDLEKVETYVSPTSIEQIKRADIALTKIASKSHERLKNVRFKVTSVTTSESSILVTDDNGFASTSSKWNPHTQNTNRGETSEDGIWFSKNVDENGNYLGESAPDNDKGALLYDTYLIEELEGESNKGMEMIPPFEVTIYKDNTVIDLGPLENERPKIPEIKTSAKDGNTNDSNVMVADKNSYIVDTVSYWGLKEDTVYNLKAVLMDKETEKPVKIDGKEVTGELEFQPTKSDGKVDVDLKFDASKLAGKEVVVFEYLSQNGKPVTDHTDINDKGQTLKIVESRLKTKATNKDSGGKTIAPEKDQTIVDTIQFEDQNVDLESVIKGIVMDKKTGKPLSVSGQAVTAEKKFKPTKPDGAFEMEFTLDASGLAGKELVIFEYQYRDNEIISEHTDINDKAQTILVNKPDKQKSDKKEKNGNDGGKVSDMKTGDIIGIIAIVIIVLSVIGAAIIMLRKRKISK